MRAFDNETFVSLYDRDSNAKFSDMAFTHCTFDNCALSLTKSVALRSKVCNVQLFNCYSFNSDVGPAILEDVLVDGLKTNDLLIFWAPLFKHVSIKGKCGKFKINQVAHYEDRSSDFQRPFDDARRRFYDSSDWALDISEASFVQVEFHSIPARLIRRNPKTQVVVTREKAIRPGWRDHLSERCDYWLPHIGGLLADGDPDIVLAAPCGKTKRDFQRFVDGLNELRDVGVAEPE
jgi:hypothetical protein